MALDLQRSGIRSEINVTPLVDVCLVLLIIFMVVIPVLQEGVKVNLPQTGKPTPMPGESTQLNVSIRQDGIYVKDDRIAEAQLREFLAAQHATNPDREVIVRGDRYLQYERICEVLAILKETGFTRVGLVTERAQATS